MVARSFEAIVSNRSAFGNTQARSMRLRAERLFHVRVSKLRCRSHLWRSAALGRSRALVPRRCWLHHTHTSSPARTRVLSAMTDRKRCQPDVSCHRRLPHQPARRARRGRGCPAGQAGDDTKLWQRSGPTLKFACPLLNYSRRSVFHFSYRYHEIRMGWPANTTAELEFRRVRSVIRSVWCAGNESKR